MEIKELLLQEAKDKGICDEGYNTMLKLKGKGLVNYYLKTIDWSLERDFPSMDILREHFSDKEDLGLYVDKTFNGDYFSDKQTFVFHNCKGLMYVGMDYDNAIIPMLYFANGCDVTIVCGQQNAFPIKIPIYSFGDNKIVTEGRGNAIFTIHKSDTIC